MSWLGDKVDRFRQVPNTYFPMHIPDGFLDIAKVATTYAISTGGMSYAVRETNRKPEGEACQN